MTSKISDSAPPAQLQNIETEAVTMIDKINSGNWTEVDKLLATVSSNSLTVTTMLASSQVPSSKIAGMTGTIGKLQNDIKLKNSFDAKVDANLLTSMICDIYDYFTLKTPSDLNRLNYYCRAINLDVEIGDWASAKLTYGNANTSWGKLKSILVNTYTADMDKTNSDLLALGTAIDAKNATLTDSQITLLFGQITKMQADFMQISSSSSS